jgi:transposase
MMGMRSDQKDLFSYAVDLDRRVRAENPLRRIRERIDFGFVREEVKGCYGYNGNVSEDPAVILKMMFLLFYDDVPSERELMRIIPERLDYLWFLGYGLDEEVPDHSVLSKARRRWGVEVFERLFVRVVGQCVAAGLVDGKKLHVDASLIDANASRDSVLKGAPEWIAALKGAYQATESKLQETTTPARRVSVNDQMLSTTDPDAGLTRMGSGQSRPRYHHHRVVDEAQGVITAIETTSGTIAENKRLLELVERHEANTGGQVQTVVADSKYGTVENYVACQQRGITTHMGDVLAKQTDNPRCRDIFPDTAFEYQPDTNTYRCPAGQSLLPRRLHPRRRTWEYHTARGVCAACALRSQCTRASYGRTIRRHEHQDLLDRARQQAHSPAAYRDRRRRMHLSEGSFADAANNHHFKRSRWRRLWRQRIQDYLIATIQNVKLLLKHSMRRTAAAARSLGRTGGTPLPSISASESPLIGATAFCGLLLPQSLLLGGLRCSVSAGITK